MNRTVHLTTLHRQPAEDLAYWLSRPVTERFAAVEWLRQQQHAGDVDPVTGEPVDLEAPIQRICRVVQRERR